MKINLNDVIECIEYEGELLTHYYNKETGVIIYIEDSSTSNYKAEDINNLDSFEEWERELITALNDFKENRDKYIQLPTYNEINEHGMMIEFCELIEDNQVKNNILEKRDNFRELREAIENAGFISKWYDFREDAEKNIAIKWCKDNGIEFYY